MLYQNPSILNSPRISKNMFLSLCLLSDIKINAVWYSRVLILFICIIVAFVSYLMRYDIPRAAVSAGNGHNAIFSLLNNLHDFLSTGVL